MRFRVTHVHVPTEEEVPSGFWLWLIGHITRQKIVFLLVVLGTSIIYALRIIIPITIGGLIDIALIDYGDIFSKEEQAALLTLFILLLLTLFVGRAGISYLVSVANDYLAWRVDRDIREEFFQKIQSKPLRFHDETRTGELMALATQDTNQVNWMLSPGLSMVSGVFVTLIFVALSFPVVDIRLLIVSLAFLPFYLYGIFIYGRKLDPISRTFMRKWESIAVACQDAISGVRVVRAFCGEEIEKQKFMKVVRDFRDTWQIRQITQALYFPSLILYIAIGSSFLIGSLLIAQGDPYLTVGKLIAFNAMLITLVMPTMTISFAIGMVAGGIAAAKRIYTKEEKEVPEEQENQNQLPWPKNVEGRVEFKDVSFAYDRKTPPVLRKISFVVEAGQTCAIVGPTGSGKSTLTKLLLRLYPVSRGQIKIDSVDVKKYRLEDLRRNIGRIEQDIFLFSTSIYNNIAYGKPNATKKEIERVAELAQAKGFIEELSEGQDTIIGERGTTLSGGQKQRIAIARTFLTDPRILVLDDSTSAIDSETEEKIVTAIHGLLQGRTTFLITHRLNTIRAADKIIVLKRGRIAAMGKHDDLIHISEDYRRIFGKKMNLPPLQSPENFPESVITA